MRIILRLALYGMWSLIFMDYTYAEEVNDKVRQGKLLAVSLCRDCHKVSKEQLRGPTLWPRAPNFVSIANQIELTDEQLRDFLKSPSHSRLTKRRMPDLPLSDEYIEQLVSYIGSLRDK